MADKPQGKAPKAGPSPELVATREALAPFLEANPGAEVIEIRVGGEPKRALRNPWNDRSLAFALPDDDGGKMIGALNALILPNRFTAIYHKDTKQFEIIFTAYQLPDEHKVLGDRKFRYTYDGKAHKCSFRRSSDRLLTLASNLVRLEMSHTSFRNLASFHSYTRKQASNAEHYQSIHEPLSFFIESLEWNEERVVEFVNNLNFYLTYYDRMSPYIELHQAADEEKPHPQGRFISGKFPSSISGKKLDNNLLSFWHASESGDSARRFQYYYRIIEYASFFYLESSARIAVRRILSSPDAIDDIAGITDKLMSAFQLSKLDDYAKFSQLISDTLDPKLLWCEVKQNIPAFSKDFKFDGGFILKAIIAPTAKESTFTPKAVETFTKAIRDIRNALSHGRDFKSATVIIPTSRNLKALEPWVHLIAVAAGQVVLYKDVT